MEPQKKRRVDRRTVYTKRLIKRVFLELKGTKSFDDITVADVCREAQISRSTFYLHYKNLFEVLDEVLEEAFSNIHQFYEQFGQQSGHAANCKLPLCMFIRTSTEYECLFFDEALHSIIVDKMAEVFYEDFYEDMRKRTSLTKLQIEALLYFQLNGCFAVTKKSRHLSESDWCVMKDGIDNMLLKGLDFEK